MNAEKARQLTNKSKDMGLNSQRVYFMERIKSAVTLGKNFIVLDSKFYKLDEDDYKWFEDKGYKVIREERKYLVRKGSGLIPACPEIIIKFGHILW